MSYSAGQLTNWDDFTGAPAGLQDIGFGPGNFTPPPSSDPSSSFWGSGWGSKESLNQLQSLSKGLGSLKAMSDPMAAQARPAAPAAQMHPGGQPAMLSQYIDTLRQRQQALRAQFMPKVSGLLGG